MGLLNWFNISNNDWIGKFGILRSSLFHCLEILNIGHFFSYGVGLILVMAIHGILC